MTFNFRGCLTLDLAVTYSLGFPRGIRDASVSIINKFFRKPNLEQWILKFNFFLRNINNIHV